MLWPFGSTWRPVWQKRRHGIELRWLSARMWTRRWYPQGIDHGVWRGRRAIAVSWFRQSLDGAHLASRITFVDLDRSRHLDVLLAIPGEDGELQPARIHAGGLAWFDERLFVAATGRGIWEFDLSDIRKAKGALAQRLTGERRKGGHVTVLVVVRTRLHPVPLRCSFLGRVFDADGAPLRKVLIGEYRTDESGQIGEFSIPEVDDGEFQELHRFVPAITHMQGVARWGERHFVSQSDQLRTGVLWSGSRTALAKDPVPLPIGCEDLALDADAELLWSLGEHPWHRVVRGTPFAQLGIRGDADTKTGTRTSTTPATGPSATNID